MGLDLICSFSNISWNGNVKRLVVSSVILLNKGKRVSIIIMFLDQRSEQNEDQSKDSTRLPTNQIKTFSILP